MHIGIYMHNYIYMNMYIHVTYVSSCDRPAPLGGYGATQRGG